MSDFPRRNDRQRWVHAEKEIANAVETVEGMGADVRLTDAVVLLGEAKNKVADFIDGVPRVEPKPLHPVGVSVLITRVNPEGETELLLGRRKNNSGAGLLSTPGGRIEKAENRFQAAMRELYEETGASIFFEKLKQLGCRERFAFGDHYFMFYFHVQSWIGADSKPNGSFENRIPDKSEDWKFYPLHTIKIEETTEPPDILAQLAPKLSNAQVRAKLQQEFD